MTIIKHLPQLSISDDRNPIFPTGLFMMNVLLIENEIDSALLEQALGQEGFNVLKLQYSGSSLQAIQQSQPDVVIFNLGLFPRTLLEDIKYINQKMPLPVLVFSDEDNQDNISQAINAGVTVLTTDGFGSRRLSGLVNVAMARFKHLRALVEALDEARAQLEDRKLIDRAKAILIKTRNFTEDEAYHTLRKLAMGRNITLGEMAKNVIAMAELLK